MDNGTPQDREITWLTLKEAARLVGCSVKTVRRRIDSGKWRSIIEYRGKKAIRLVARSDALSETSILRLRDETISPAAPHPALDSIGREVGQLLDRTVDRIEHRIEHRVVRLRAYLLAAAGVIAIFIMVIGIFFLSYSASTSPDNVPDNRFRIEHSLINLLSRNRRETRSLNQSLDMVRKDLAGFRRRSDEVGNTTENLKGEIAALNRELERLRADMAAYEEERRLTLDAIRDSIPEPKRAVERADRPASTPPPAPSPLPTAPEEVSSGFLGIF